MYRSDGSYFGNFLELRDIKAMRWPAPPYLVRMAYLERQQDKIWIEMDLEKQKREHKSRMEEIAKDSKRLFKVK